MKLSITKTLLSLSIVAALLGTAAQAEKAPGVEATIANADGKAGTEVTFEALVIGVCRSGGKKIFVRDEGENAATVLRVERGKNLAAFDRELEGETLRITGVLRENRITAKGLDNSEARARVQLKAELEAAKKGSHSKDDDCQHDCPENPPAQKTLDLIASYRAQLAKSGKGYISRYWIEGVKWEKVPQS